MIDGTGQVRARASASVKSDEGVDSPNILPYDSSRRLPPAQPLRSEASIIANMAEELSFYHQPIKQVEKRSLRSFHLKEYLKNDELFPLEEINLIADSADNDDLRRNFHRYASDIALMAADDNNILLEIRRHSSDPAHQMAILLLAKSLAKKSGDAHSTERIADAILRMDQSEFGRIARVGCNIIPIAAIYAKNPSEAKTLRRGYEVILIDELKLSKFLSKILDKFQDVGFTKALEFMIRGVSAEMQSLRPSLDRVLLRTILADLYNLQAISTLLVRARTVASQLSGKSVNMSDFSLMQSIVSMIDMPAASPAIMQRLASKYKITDESGLRTFYTGVASILASLPLKLFDRLDARSTLIESARSILKSLNDAEDN